MKYVQKALLKAFLFLAIVACGGGLFADSQASFVADDSAAKTLALFPWIRGVHFERTIQNFDSTLASAGKYEVRIVYYSDEEWAADPQGAGHEVCKTNLTNTLIWKKIDDSTALFHYDLDLNGAEGVAQEQKKLHGYFKLYLDVDGTPGQNAVESDVVFSTYYYGAGQSEKIRFTLSSYDDLLPIFVSVDGFSTTNRVKGGVMAYTDKDKQKVVFTTNDTTTIDFFDPSLPLAQMAKDIFAYNKGCVQLRTTWYKKLSADSISTSYNYLNFYFTEELFYPRDKIWCLDFAGIKTRNQYPFANTVDYVIPLGGPVMDVASNPAETNRLFARVEFKDSGKTFEIPITSDNIFQETDDTYRIRINFDEKQEGPSGIDGINYGEGGCPKADPEYQALSVRFVLYHQLNETEVLVTDRSGTNLSDPHTIIDVAGWTLGNPGCRTYTNEYSVLLYDWKKGAQVRLPIFADPCGWGADPTSQVATVSMGEVTANGVAKYNTFATVTKNSTVKSNGTQSTDDAPGFKFFDHTNELAEAGLTLCNCTTYRMISVTEHGVTNAVDFYFGENSPLPPPQPVDPDPVNDIDEGDPDAIRIVSIVQEGEPEAGAWAIGFTVKLKADSTITCADWAELVTESPSGDCAWPCSIECDSDLSAGESLVWAMLPVSAVAYDSKEAVWDEDTRTVTLTAHVTSPGPASEGRAVLFHVIAVPKK